MTFHLSNHAIDELRRRGIPRSILDAVLAAPEQRIPNHGDIVCYQSRVTINGKAYLVRAMVNESKQPPVVVTAYRTSNLSKYWSQP
ncbi:MAG TPA: DUF4258 domain-containing protein [Planctomycetota bacterium]|nr:DUF4258 domain-containing protein [Planctomycetota bacterium]